MMTRLLLILAMIATAMPGAGAAEVDTDRLARCLTEKGWVMYGSITCSACRAQRKAFGDALALIAEVECNPYAPDNEAERCIARDIAVTPTWIQEQDGAEITRIVGYQLLEDLARETGCE